MLYGLQDAFSLARGKTGQDIHEMARKERAKVQPSSILSRVLLFFPILKWLPTYSRSDFMGDLFAGRWPVNEILQLEISKFFLNSNTMKTLSSINSCLFNAGITVGLMVLPQGIAYAELCDLPHQYGIYTALPGVLFYLVMGTAKDITVGPTAIVSLLVGNVTHSLNSTKYVKFDHVICKKLRPNDESTMPSYSGNELYERIRWDF